MSWNDFVAIAPTIVGTVIAVLAIIETFTVPETLTGKLTWAAIFVVLGVIAIWFTVQQQRIATAEQKRNQKEAKEDRDRFEKKLEAVGGGVEELKKLTESKPDEPAEKVLAAAAAKILDLDAKTKSQGEQIAGLEKQIAPRSLTPAQHDAIKARLLRSNIQCVVAVTSLMGDPDGVQYIGYFSKAIEDGGWRTRLGPGWLQVAGDARGLSFRIQNQTGNQCAQVLAEALRDAGFPYPVTAVVRADLKEDVELVVGNRDPSEK